MLIKTVLLPRVWCNLFLIARQHSDSNSVRPSVCYTPVLYWNDWIYHISFSIL